MFTRIAMPFGINRLITMKPTWFSIDLGWISGSFTSQGIILFCNDLLLIYKNTDALDKKTNYNGKRDQDKIRNQKCP